MRTLCFGGTFNPIHHGHLIGARAAAEEGGFGRVLLIPAGRPPHKDAAVAGAEATDRLAMCHAAVLGDPFFEVCDLEIRRSGRSYTVETVEALAGQMQRPIDWLIGADSLPTLPTWHRPLDLLRHAIIHYLARPGYEINWDELPEPYQGLRQNCLPAPRIDISSTDIRRRIAGGQPIDYLTPPAVVRYIRDRRLYATGR